MRSLFSLVLSVSLIVYIVFSPAGVMANNLNLLVTGNNAFALDIYKELSEEEGNIFISPYSISSALAMTYAGARGDTAKEMADTLHFNLPQEELHSGFYNLSRLLDATGKSYQLSVANALWGQRDYKFNKEFLDITNRYYEAGFKEVDYIDEENRERTRETINKWVEDKTNNKIRELIQPRDLTSLTRLVLTNAIYFKGKWEVQFDPEETRDMPFYISEREKKETPMMHQTSKFNYMENDSVQVLELPYTGGDLSMVVILPRPDISLYKVEKGLSSDKLQSWLDGLSKEDVDVYLPRFKMEKRFMLNDTLQKLGMKLAFDEFLADFSGMTPKPDLHISKVIHQSFVEVNEEGTEAAAATAVIMGGKAVGIGPALFKADRPFIFLIRDIPSGSILFIGRLVEPGK